MAVVNKGVITVLTDVRGYHPVFAREMLTDEHSFQVEIIDKTCDFVIGVASAEVRNSLNKYGDPNSIGINANSGVLFVDGNQEKH